jgi:hypothetical protein
MRFKNVKIDVQNAEYSELNYDYRIKYQRIFSLQLMMVTIILLM